MSDGPRDAHRLFGGAYVHYVRGDHDADTLGGRGDILREEHLKAAIERELAAKYRFELEARLIDTKIRIVNSLLDHIKEVKAEDPRRADAYYDKIIKILGPAPK